MSTTRPRLLSRASLRFLWRHPWQFGLSLLGVGLGVAATVSVALANASALRAFELASEALRGPATHQIVAGDLGFDEQVLYRVRVQLGQQRAAPLLRGWVDVVDASPPRRFEVIGIDPVSERSLRRHLGGLALATVPGNGALTQLIGAPDAVFLSREDARGLGLAVGDTIAVRVGGHVRSLRVVGVVPDTGATLAGKLLVDIAAAQEVLEQPGRLSRIDLVIPPAAAEQVRGVLPPGVELVGVEQRAGATIQMTRAFRLNLTAMSLLALLCGLFLIFNTMTFSVLQRRELFGSLRALGVTPGQLLRRILAESLLVGGLGTLVGLVGGAVLARGLVRLVVGTLNDLYFSVQVAKVSLSPPVLIAAAALGILGSLLAALVPALEATRTRPRIAMTRSVVESRARARAPWTMAAGSLGVLVGGAVIGFSRELTPTFVGLFVAVLGAAMVTPVATLAVARLSRRPLRILLGAPGNLAGRGLRAGLSRTSVAVAALTIAVSLIIGVNIMVGSFRSTLVRWLGYTLAADLYVAPAGSSSVSSPLALDAELLAELTKDPAVVGASTLRRRALQSGAGLTSLLVIGGGPGLSARYRLAGAVEDPWEEFWGGAVFVSESYARLRGTGAGGSVRLLTDSGESSFPVAGVYYSYASDRGAVLMARPTYESRFADRGFDGVSLQARPEADLTALGARVRRRFADRQPVQIVSNRELRSRSLAIFDRTFLITSVLQALVAMVAFAGVLSALLAMQLERGLEFGMLRAAGMTPRQLWHMVLAQTGLLGAVAGLLAVPVGLALAWVMIFVINRRSFGWTLLMQVSPVTLAQALALAIGAALLAGVVPAARSARSSPAGVLRRE